MNTIHERPTSATSEPLAAEWGTIQEAAYRRFVSVQTMRRYIRLGLVEAERLGPRLIRVNLTSLNTAGRPLDSDAQ